MQIVRYSAVCEHCT